ncbi:MAG: helix-turn-helix domain-containing protein [Alphaproteobacteria bacterium]|nr:helix-turn-helix domain-containing protein [Alphaproteobacteria bacterium]
MPTIEQIRAARALLDWSQSDLADRAGLSQTGIARIENGTNQPNSSTLAKIEAAFEKGSIEFLGLSGVRLKTGEIKTFRGQEGFRAFMDDVYETARDKGGEICLFNGVPRFFSKFLGEEWYQMHSARMQQIKDKFTFKIIVREGDEHTIAQGFAEYRWFPENLFNERTFYAYGDRLAFMNFSDDNVTIRVLPQEEFADSFRVLFNIAWDNIAKPIRK